MSWTYSGNDETFNDSVVDTREEAIINLRQEHVLTIVVKRGWSWQGFIAKQQISATLSIGG